jgi:N-acyl homoserine lactone hydrolase
MRLYLLQLGLMPAFGGVPVPGYLIQTDDGTNVLVDTGYPRTIFGKHEQAAAQISASLPEDTFMPSVVRALRNDPADFITNQLALLGLTPGDIDYLVCTHFDWDHAGNHDLFVHAELVVQKRHSEVARKAPRFQLFDSPWNKPELRYRLLDGDTELLPDVTLIETPGHVPGHQSVLVRLPETGSVLLAGDALIRADRLNPEAPPLPQDMDHSAVRRTTESLRAVIEREGVRLIIFGHDAQQWRTLKLAPDYYQ